MKDDVCILSMIYMEPEYCEVLQCVSRTKVPTFFADRDGVGNLAEAFNKGFRDNRCERFKYTWFLTNSKFGKEVLPTLFAAAEAGKWAAVTPAFKSDHASHRPTGSTEVKAVPFVEFTCPLVRSAVFADHALDEQMPYIGHDLDWGHRVRNAGYKLAVAYGATVNHTYIRHNKLWLPITRRRRSLRKKAQGPTEHVLARKYGPNWKAVLSYQG